MTYTPLEGQSDDVHHFSESNTVMIPGKRRFSEKIFYTSAIKKLLFLFKSTQGRFPSANPSKCVISRTKANIIGHPPFWLTESTNHIPASHPSPNIDFFVWCVKVHRITKFLITAQGKCYKWLQTFDFYGAQSSIVNYFKNDSSWSI